MFLFLFFSSGKVFKDFQFFLRGFTGQDFFKSGDRFEGPTLVALLFKALELQQKPELSRQVRTKGKKHNGNTQNNQTNPKNYEETYRKMLKKHTNMEQKPHFFNGK